MEGHQVVHKQNSWNPAEAVCNNTDLFTEILLRLPAKHVVRSKCVSKKWLSLISDPRFCLSYNRHHQTPTALLFKKKRNPTLKFLPLQRDTTREVPCFDYLNAASGFRIMQSCNGLLLCFQSTRTESGREHIYHICNPSTNQFKRLSLPGRDSQESLVAVSMAFDPLKSSHYKLIYVRRVRRTGEYHIDMFSSETDSWRPLGITFTPPKGVRFSRGVFCNGVVHWYGGGETSLSFDVDRERLNTMPMPNLAQPRHVVRFFGESRGHLHLIVTDDPNRLQFDVLEIAMDYSGWFVRYHVNLDAVRIAFPKILWGNADGCKFSVLGVIRAQKEEESIVVVYGGDKAISYNVHYGTRKKLCDIELIPTRGLELNLPQRSSNYTWRDTFQCFESLTYV